MSSRINKIDRYGRLALKKYQGLNRRLGLGIKRRVPYENVYHCCVQRTASQWFKGLFRDYVVYQHTGLDTEEYPELALKGSTGYERGIPSGVFAAHLYSNFDNYQRIEKPETYRTIFVTRDPRDIVVSFYFSTKYSHPAIAYIPQMRKDLEPLGEQEGLCYIIDRLRDLGLFDAQRSWVDREDDRTRLFKYEELAENHEKFIADLFDHLSIKLTSEKLASLAERHSFRRMALGRKRGEEDLNSDYRKGQAGDWKNHLEPDSLKHFRTVTGDLIDVLRYSD